MSSKITFTNEYFVVLNKMLKIVVDLPNTRHALLYKKDDRFMHSAMALDTLVNTSAPSTHINFEPEKVGITNLNEFINYTKAIEYPKNESEINLIEEKTTKGDKINSFRFEGKHATYRMPVAQMSAFRKDYDLKVPIARDKDPLELVGKFYLDNDDLKRIVTDIQLMGKSNSFGLSIANDKIVIYMTNIQKHQITKVIDETKSKVFNGYSTTGHETTTKHPFKLFPNKIFSYMYYFGCDFEVELRVMKRGNGDLMAVKCFGVMDFTPKKKTKTMKKVDKAPSDPKEPINIFVGTHENSAHAASANMLKIVRE